MSDGLTIKDLTRPGLQPVSLTADPGACVALRGPSGSGKSLFLRAVADLDPNEGEVSFDATDRAAVPAPAWRKLAGYLHPDAGWWADRVDGHFADWDAAEPLVVAFGLPTEVVEWQITRLSTGEKQRLALARLLAAGPRLLLLDEPTSALDNDTALAVETVLRERLADGAVILMATHDPAQAERLGARILAFENGTATEAPAKTHESAP